MAILPVHNQAGQQVGTYDLDFNEIALSINKQLLHDVVVMYEANQRVGTARSRSRGEIAGSTKKLYKQKGTGRARMGPKRTPIRRGGGHAFRKVARDWGYRLPKKAIRLATRMALLSKFQDNQVTVLNSWDVTAPKTKVVAAALKGLGLSEKSCLLATDAHNPILWKSSRNIPEIEVYPAADLNAYVLLRQRQLVVTTAALDVLRKPVAETASE
ncbi:MAG: ribosomal protein L4/L1e [Planctomycetaceae bacterium]|nr:ribosomal protein L4/L1e [Planctomycetaceae bacterium]